MDIIQKKSSVLNPFFTLLLPTKGRYEMLVRMLSSAHQAAGDIPWEALILYANPDNRAYALAESFPHIVLFNQDQYFPTGRPRWPAMMQFLLDKTRSPWFMYASDDIIFAPDSIQKTLETLQNFSGLAAGVAMAYRNTSPADPKWTEYGIDLTLGDQILINYGFINTDFAKKVGGFSHDYQFYCADGDLCLKLLQAGFQIIPCLDAHVLHDNVLDQIKGQNLAIAEQDIAVYRKKWTPIYYDVTEVKRLLPHSPNADSLMPPGKPSSLSWHSIGTPTVDPDQDALHALYLAGLYRPGQPLRLHLGCGENYLNGYVNIDYPPEEHSLMKPKADIFADIKQLRFPSNCVDEIRLHHVFEHFNRIEALGMLIRFHRWLRVGGMLHIEVPDLEGSAKTILSAVPFKQKCAAVRHLTGDQTELWGYHVEQWFPERLQVTFTHMGFGEPMLRSENWNRPPYLANITAISIKQKDIPTSKLLEAADELLWLSIVGDSELPMYETWQKKLRKFLHYQPIYHTPTATSNLASLLPPPPDSPPLSEIHDFNQRTRDLWMAKKASTIPAGSAVLDVGAGTCPYRGLFAHCHYVAHDFKKYEGIKLDGTTEYGAIDLVSDITAIPSPDASFDVIVCTEVLEHVPDPVAALREMSRLLKPNGRILITAPLGSGLHQEPFHFYGGFTRHFYEYFLPQVGIRIVELQPNGGFFRHLAQECARVAWTFEHHREFHKERQDMIQKLFAEYLPRYLYAMDEKYMNEAFTVGYFVEGIKT